MHWQLSMLWYRSGASVSVTYTYFKEMSYLTIFFRGSVLRYHG